MSRKANYTRKSSVTRTSSKTRKAQVKKTPIIDYNRIYVSSWSKTKKAIQTRRYNEYEQYGLIPFFRVVATGYGTRSTNEILDIDEFANIPQVDLLVEKESFLTKEQKQQNYLSTAGNQIQAKVDKNLNFVGFYFQDATKDIQLPHFARSKEIIVDNDDTGHFIAFMNNLYSFGNPYIKNVRFDNRGELQRPDKIKAYRFMAKNIVDSASYQRNKIIQKFLEKQVGLKLAYRTSSGKTQNVTISEQKLAICRFLYSKNAFLDVTTPDLQLSFQYEVRNIPDDKEIVLEFVPIKQKEVKMLNSDDLLHAIVMRYNIEPDTTQSILENLYYSGWINYPRADVKKAEDVPIKLLRDIKEFKGGVLEKNILQLIKESTEAYNQGVNFIQNGNWVLKAGDTIISKIEGINFADLPHRYDNNTMDIKVRYRGRKKEELTDYLIKNNIGTPATRTSMLRELKEAGIVSKQDDIYQLDTRGLIFASSYEVLKKRSFTAIELKRKIDTAKSLEEINQLLHEIKPLTDDDKREMVKMMNAILEYADDLKRLDEI